MQRDTHAPPAPPAWPLPAAELRPALELALTLARADMTVLLLHDETAGALVPAAAYGLDDDQAALIGAHQPGADAFSLALSEHRRVVVRDALDGNESFGPLAHSLGVRAFEIVPLFGLDGQTIGELVMMFRQARTTSKRMVRLVDQCARLVVVAVSQARGRADAERARERTEQAGRAKIQFFARMSHELRTPLQSIAGYIDLLRVGAADPPTPEQARLLARVHDSEEVLVHVIDDLITFSRLEAGHVSYQIAPVSAAEAIRIAHSVVAPLASSHSVSLETTACAGLFVSADGDKLKQILVNLAANAVKFCGTGGVVRISCQNDEDCVRFDVSDNGPGIPGDRLGDIFEPYVQLATPAFEGFGGTGLGLAISREFATGMHGQLTVASNLGLGSVFTLRIPSAVSIAASAAANARDAAPPLADSRPAA
ncbi:MAG TPA: HAMP domain-containing sensor histidine kinase [Gemmatimonadaceae bacterium]|jgi:signal transduction histidine kinase|nr:HAMP domain-containing sensor histidine kinase [Gemmatimonadaceae bacterium]